MIITCFRSFGVSDLREAERMTLYEYRLRTESYLFRQIDREREIYLQAWTAREVKAEKMVGKNKKQLVYKEFEDFYDYEKRIKALRNPSGMYDSRIRRVARRIERLRKEGADGKL